MKNTKKIILNKAGVVKASFSGSNLTRYSGLNVVAKYMNRQGIIKSISKAFQSPIYNATKFGINQIMLSVIFASMSGINRMSKISMFTNDGLVRSILKLNKGINKNALSTELKKLGQTGSRCLQSLLLSKNSSWLDESNFRTTDLDGFKMIPVCKIM